MIGLKIVFMPEKEEQFLQRINTKQTEAFRELFSEFYNSLVLFAMGFVEQQDVAEDIVQEIFFKLYTDKPTFDVVVALKSYLYLVTKNQCLNYLKHARIEQEYMSFLKERETTTFFFNQIVEQELLTLLSEAIQDLPEQTGQVFQLVMEGFDNAEIAEKLNLSIDSVKSHKKRGKQLLKSRLGDITAILLFLSNC